MIHSGPLCRHCLSMFSQVATASTLLAMLVHSVLGCCWHHDHASHRDIVSCAVSGHPEGDDEIVSPIRKCCGHKHASDAAPAHQGSDENSPCDHSDGGCVEAHCVYTASNEAKLPSDLVQFAMLVTPLQATATLCPPSVAVLSAIENGPLPRAAAAVCAQLQVWLI